MEEFDLSVFYNCTGVSVGGCRVTDLLNFTLTDYEQIRRSDRYGKMLSIREMQVIKLMSLGKTRDEIAEELSISSHTVRNQVSCIFDKLNIDSNIKVVIVYLNEEIPDNMIPISPD